MLEHYLCYQMSLDFVSFLYVSGTVLRHVELQRSGQESEEVR